MGERPSFVELIVPFLGWVVLDGREAQGAGVPDGTRAFVFEWLTFGVTLIVEVAD